MPLPGTFANKYFTGSSFTDYFCYNDKISIKIYNGVSNNPVGSNLQSFIFLAQANELIFKTITPAIDQVNVGILHWDGNKVSIECWICTVLMKDMILRITYLYPTLDVKIII